MMEYLVVFGSISAGAKEVFELDSGAVWLCSDLREPIKPDRLAYQKAD